MSNIKLIPGHFYRTCRSPIFYPSKGFPANFLKSSVYLFSTEEQVRDFDQKCHRTTQGVLSATILMYLSQVKSGLMRIPFKEEYYFTDKTFEARDKLLETHFAFLTLDGNILYFTEGRAGYQIRNYLEPIER